MEFLAEGALTLVVCAVLYYGWLATFGTAKYRRWQKDVRRVGPGTR